MTKNYYSHNRHYNAFVSDNNIVIELPELFTTVTLGEQTISKVVGSKYPILSAA
jgi:hypothetical protein